MVAGASSAVAVTLTGGEFGGIPLESVKGLDTRVASAKLRTSLFDILKHRIEGARVLDLFAGIGTFGLEALSRGASHATFLEQSDGCVRVIRKNLEKLRCADRGRVIRGNAFGAAARFKGESFRLVFIDPPYPFYEEPKKRRGLQDLIVAIHQGGIIEPEGQIVLKHSARAGPGEVAGLRLLDRREYGDTELSFYGG